MALNYSAQILSFSSLSKYRMMLEQKDYHKIFSHALRQALSLKGSLVKYKQHKF